MPAREKVVAARRSLFATALLLTAGLSATSEAASECRAYDAGARPRIGLVLGGGGARGGAHVGVLKFLEEQRIPVDMIAGTSMGALVGGLYSVGMDAGEIEQLLQNTNWAGMFDDKSSRDEQPLRRKLDDDLGLYGPKLGVGKDSTLLPAGALAGQKVGLLLERLISSHHESADFDLLPIPYRAVASDLVSGNMVLLDRGKLALAMRASMSVPGAFDPVRQGDALLVDGGITRNLPIDIARQMGADRVIAVNVGYPKLGADELRNVVSIVGQLTTLMVQGNTEAQIATLAPGDVLIEPALGTDFSSADFNRLAEIVPLGYTASMALAQQLAQFSVPEAEYRAWRRSISSCESGVPVIHFIRLDNRSRFADDVLSRMITLQPGQPLDYARLERDISRIYGLGFIRHARYSIVEEGGRQGLLIEVEQDVRGSDFVETGLGITNAGRGTSLDFKVAYLKTDITDRGAEFRTAMQFGEEFGVNAELYLPVDDKLQWIFRPDLRAHERDILVFDETAHPLGQLQLQEIGGSLVFGREFARHSGLFLGASSYVGDISVSVGYPSGLGDYRYHGGEWKLQFIYDRLDSRFLPSEGSSLRLSYNKASESLGADDVFEQWSFQWFTARSWGPHTGWIGSSLFTSVDDRAPVYALYSGGGFLNMSGYERDALVGENFGYSLLGYRYRMGAGGLLPAYVGMTVEYGNAAERLQDVYGNGILNGSFYLGYDSPLGPLYLGYGWSEDTSGLLFLRLGNVLGAQSIGRR